MNSVNKMVWHSGNRLIQLNQFRLPTVNSVDNISREDDMTELLIVLIKVNIKIKLQQHCVIPNLTLTCRLL